MRRKIFMFFIFLGIINSYSMELSLEENKAESGTIGYVDIEKVFQKYSVKTEIRNKFLEKMKEKEEILYSKKEEINEIKNQLLKLKQEKELAISLDELYNSFKEKATDIISKSSFTDSQNISSVSVAEQSSFEISNSSQNFEEISISSISISTNPVIEKIVLSDSQTLKMPVISMPGVGDIPMSHFKFSVSTSAADIEKIISEKSRELEQKEEELKKMREDFNKELLGYEEDQTEKILGNIYLKLKELSIREGVSVVVDKKSILFGHKAVDLTDKLISELEKEQ